VAGGPDAGHRALSHLDALLLKAPRADSTLFSYCTQCLAVLRDELIAAHRAGTPSAEARTRLAHVNAIISVVMAGHFPLGPVPWDELRKARSWLADVLAA
jgi:hypothetical protein